MKKISNIFVRHREETVESVVSPHLDALYAQAFQYTGDRDSAQDLLQDMLVNILQDEGKVLKLDPVKPWLMRCLYNRFIDHCRKAGREVDARTEIELDQLEGSERGPESKYYHGQVVKSLSCLTPDQRVAVVLFDLKGHSLEEVSNVMGVPTGTVKSHLHRARKRLKEKLSVQPFRPKERYKE